MKLLVDDGFEQSFKRRVLGLEPQSEGTGRVDEFAEARIGLGKLPAGEIGIVTYRAATVGHGGSVEQDQGRLWRNGWKFPHCRKRWRGYE